MPDHLELARLTVRLYREFLPDDRPLLNACVEVGTIPPGPSRAGLKKLQAVQEHFGAENVTTGVRPREDEVGVWVRGETYRRVKNPLRAYVSRA